MIEKIHKAACLAGIALMALSSCGKEKPGLDKSVERILITSPAGGSMEIVQGESGRIRYSTIPEEAASTAVIEWTSDNEEVASVRNGRVTGYAPGDACITASCGKASAKVNVTVIPVPVTSFKVPASLKVYMNTPVKVNVDVAPSSANAASLKWSVDKPEMATVSFSEGEAYVNALKTGSFKVTVSSETAGTKEISCTAYEERMWLYYLSGGSKVAIADGATLKADVLPTDSKGRVYVCMELKPQEDISGKVELSSDNAEVFSCSAEYPSSVRNIINVCLTSGSDFGTAGIAVNYTESGQAFIRKFSVTKEASAFPSSALICYQGISQAAPKEEHVALGYTRKYEVRTSASSSASFRARWKSSDEKIATVTTSEMYSSVAEVKVNTSGNCGKVTITATDESGNSSRAIVLNVTRPFFGASTYVVDGGTGSKVLEDRWLYATSLSSASLILKISDSFLKAKWTSSNTNVWKPSSGYTGSITVKPVAYGVTTITATDECGENSLSFKLTVTPDLSMCSLLGVGDVKLDYTGSAGDYSKQFYVNNNGTRIKLSDIQGLTYTVTAKRNADRLRNAVSLTKSSDNLYLNLKWKEYSGECEVTISDGKGNKVSRTQTVLPIFSKDDDPKTWVLAEECKSDYNIFKTLYQTKDAWTYDSVLKKYPGASSSDYKFAFHYRSKDSSHGVYDMPMDITIVAEYSTGGAANKTLKELKDLGPAVYSMFKMRDVKVVKILMRSGSIYVAEFYVTNPF